MFYILEEETFQNQKFKRRSGRNLALLKHKNIYLWFSYIWTRSSGFGLLYDKLEDAIKYDPNHRFLKNEIRDLRKNTQKILKKSKKKLWCHAKKKKIVEPLSSSSIYEKIVRVLFLYFRIIVFISLYCCMQ